jgi:hypothetical protein
VTDGESLPRAKNGEKLYARQDTLKKLTEKEKRKKVSRYYYSPHVPSIAGVPPPAEEGGEALDRGV